MNMSVDEVQEAMAALKLYRDEEKKQQKKAKKG